MTVKQARTLPWLAGLALGLTAVMAPVHPGVAAPAAPRCDTPSTRFCSSTIKPPAGWRARLFRLSQAYPAAAPRDAQPWKAIDPKTQPEAYLRAVLDYFYEGNIRPDVATSFDPRLNRVRGWYNAPWQDFGMNGREPLHGLTRERVSLPFELSAKQSHAWNNYAIGFYNAPGGVAIGKVWADHGRPNAAMALAPEGTVAAKLLFTTAPVSEVDYLKGAPTWKAYVFADANDPQPTPTSPRAVRAVRLLQIDIAVKDSRAAATTGWIFGTFVYGGGPGGRPGEGWRHVEPVGLMWGDDPGYSGTGPLTETRLNPAVHMPHLGYQGRLNGPVDNPGSSCISCHATAEAPESLDAVIANLTPPKGADPSPWFRNLPSGTPFTAGKTALDNSLQLAFGLASFEAAKGLTQAPNPQARRTLMQQVIRATSQPPRGGAAQ